MLVYSITSRRSLEELNNIRQAIINYKGTADVPMVLVGNKMDLHKTREVETGEGREVAKRFDCAHVETSAKKNINIAEIFYLLIDEIWDREETDHVKPSSEKCTLL